MYKEEEINSRGVGVGFDEVGYRCCLIIDIINGVFRSMFILLIADTNKLILKYIRCISHCFHHITFLICVKYKSKRRLNWEIINLSACMENNFITSLPHCLFTKNSKTFAHIFPPSH